MSWAETRLLEKLDSVKKLAEIEKTSEELRASLNSAYQMALTDAIEISGEMRGKLRSAIEIWTGHCSDTSPQPDDLQRFTELLNEVYQALQE